MIALDRDLFCAFQLERLWETPFPRCILCFSRSHRDWQRNHMNQNLSASFVWSNPNGIHKLCMSVLRTSQNTRQPAILNWDCIGREWSVKLRLWNPSSARLDGYIIVRVRYRRIHIWSIWCVICLGPPSAGRGWRAEDGWRGQPAMIIFTGTLLVDDLCDGTLWLTQLLPLLDSLPEWSAHTQSITPSSRV